MSDAFEYRERRFAEWFGWSPAASRCPRFAAEKRCLGYNRDDCICHRFGHSIIDHAATWRSRTGKPIWTGEPYDIDPGELLKFEQEVEALGLYLRVSPRSGWNPGSSVLLVVGRRNDR